LCCRLDCETRRLILSSSLSSSFVANWVGYGCQFLKNDGQWRVPLAIQIVPALILGLVSLKTHRSVPSRFHSTRAHAFFPFSLHQGMFVLPFSPRWLAQEVKLTIIVYFPLFPRTSCSRSFYLSLQGRHEEAMASLIRLHGSEANRELIAFEYDEIVTQVSCPSLRFRPLPTRLDRLIFVSPFSSFPHPDRLGEGQC